MIHRAINAEESMADVKDPVCGMMIDASKAEGTSTWQGTTYYFCSKECKRLFDQDPQGYVTGEKQRAMK
jgi:YHS domain-containing protein